MWRAWACAAAFALAACSPSAADAPIAEQWRRLDLNVTQIEFGAESVGQLRFRGGLHLQVSPDDVFGGLSGLEVLEDGRLVAITDDGRWFEAQLNLDEAGALVGLSDARIALMRDEDGLPFENKAAGDSEGLAQLPDGRFAVSFEQRPRMLIYDLNRDGPFGAAQRGPRLAETSRLRRNVGLEALAVTSEGALLVGAEGLNRRSTPLWVAPLDASSPAPQRVNYPLSDGFALTSLDHLPDGGFVVLERFYAPIIGARARVTRFAEASLDASGEALPGVELLAEITPPLAVDNFEGVAAVRAPDGGVRLYVVSDDNFSARQRTLLLAFDLVE
ncbi:esterase-like activity of phytase family protein [Vitreimonas flagellata]|uniref:esterase-like activity of phytase family protein n=1 Tax=Vitreimonas flagellata TaxID=2560861 RepID=UPI0010750237|nr:esterase-like activity of phytase family protein [Vitreimonas flagellata]